MDNYSEDISLEDMLNSSAVAMPEPESLNLIIPVSLAYILIFIAGVLGNISTCVVIARNRSMHTATNFYLFSLAISDLILLICGLPLEIHRMWNPPDYPLGEGHCIALGLASETAANATVLTITAFTVERYIAICRPFMSHTMTNLSRIIRFIIAIWIAAVITAVPQALQFGLEITYVNDTQKTITCTVKGEGVHHVFIMSSLFFFVLPMTIISVLYALIAVKLRTSSVLKGKKPSVDSQERNNATGTPSRYRNARAQRRVIRMLVAVALSFFICWAPFHVQRLLAMLGKKLNPTPPNFYLAYVILTWMSGILYYLSTAINPFLYSIMSNKFRNAFKVTFSGWCNGRSGRRNYSAVQSFRAQRAACLSEQHPRRLHRLNTATTQLGDAPSRAQFFNGEEHNSVEDPSSLFNTWSWSQRHRPSSETGSPATISNSSLREINEEMSGAEMVVFMHEVNRELGLT
ncbi:pyrokinin-1 receptor-like [Amyelois transitella]|uniref:pyrokinin-1 receptor-like n=1 Tax=Amyelois transitella TaxID=680683 RepID=UPI00298F75A4|nr:pyrokinin-1 receptor-like [Amyelois transitella]